MNDYSFGGREKDPVSCFEMYLYGAHFLGEILRSALYQPLPQISGKLCARISGKVHTAARGSPHSYDNLMKKMPGTRREPPLMYPALFVRPHWGRRAHI